jgi:phage terminase Nu1 subunit (DNA packaging protein)
MVCNKRELAAALKCSMPTIDAWMMRWPDFPVVQRGTQGAPWAFDPAAVTAFVQARRLAEREAKRERADALAQFVLPLLGDADQAPGAGAPSPAEQLTLARLRRIQREEAIASGRLVEAAPLAAALADVFGRLGRGLRSGLRQVMATHGVPPECAAAVEAEFAAQQRRAVARISAQLAQPIAAREDEPVPALRLVAG